MAGLSLLAFNVRGSMEGWIDRMVTIVGVTHGINRGPFFAVCTSNFKRYAVLIMGLLRPIFNVVVVVRGVGQIPVPQSRMTKAVRWTPDTVRLAESPKVLEAVDVGERMGFTPAREGTWAQTGDGRQVPSHIAGQAVISEMRSRPLVTRVLRIVTRSVGHLLYAGLEVSAT